MTSAERARKYRRRRDAGEISLRVTVPQVDLVEALIDAKRLDPRDESNRTAIQQSVEKLLLYLISVSNE